MKAEHEKQLAEMDEKDRAEAAARLEAERAEAIAKMGRLKPQTLTGAIRAALDLCPEYVCALPSRSDCMHLCFVGCAESEIIVRVCACVSSVRLVADFCGVCCVPFFSFADTSTTAEHH